MVVIRGYGSTYNIIKGDHKQKQTKTKSLKKQTSTSTHPIAKKKNLVMSRTELYRHQSRLDTKEKSGTENVSSASRFN